MNMLIIYDFCVSMVAYCIAIEIYMGDITQTARGKLYCSQYFFTSNTYTVASLLI